MAGHEGDLTERVERIEYLLSIIAKAVLAPVLSKELSDQRAKEFFELTGSATSKEIAKKLGCSMTYISETWRRWEQLGLVVKDGAKYRKAVADV